MSLDALAHRWEQNAAAWEGQAKRINRSRCHDGDRNLRLGLAEAARMCASQLREAIAQQQAEVTQGE